MRPHSFILPGFLLEKFRGAKDNRPLLSKQQAIVSIVLSIVLYFRGKRLWGGGAKVVLGATPCPPVAESQLRHQIQAADKNVRKKA